MKKLFISAVVLLVLPVCVSAQDMGPQPFKNIEILHRGDMVEIKGEVNFDYFDLHRQQMAVVTPMLRSYDGTSKVRMEPIVVAGKKRYRVVDREVRFRNKTLVPDGAKVVKLKKPKKQERMLFSERINFRNWMYDANLDADISISGCAQKPGANYISQITEQPFIMLEEPAYRVSYVMPPVEEVKQRSESHTAYINFVVAKYELLRDYKNNAQELAAVDRIVSELRNDTNLSINKLVVTGYASPEGNAQSNMVLSQNRTRAFIDYLVASHTISRSIIEADSKGDDWEGLRKAMVASDFFQKDRVIYILDNSSDPTRRKAQLRSLTGYKQLLDTYYPPLRRTEYTISYIAKAFDLQEARDLILTKPQYLSLNEMYLVANSYDRNSPQFKQVFDIAARMYPDDAYARTNSAAVDIENGAYDTAIARLGSLDTPQALNNAGAAYARKKDYGQAAEFFRRAMNAGSDVAGENLHSMEEWLSETGQ